MTPTINSTTTTTTATPAIKKQVLAIRHGQSEWNVAIQQYYDKQVKSRWCPETYKPDCNITAKGREQALKAGQELSEKYLNKGRDYTLIASPLRRAIQTAQGVVENCLECSPTRKIVDWRCAEVMVDSCDIGTPVEDLEQEFPNWDFSMLRQQRPKYWWPHHRSLEETYQRMEGRDTEGEETDAMTQARLKEFKEYVLSLLLPSDETGGGGVGVDTLVIVAHSEIIWWLTSHWVGEGRDRKVKGVWSQNGQVVDVTGAFLEGYTIDPSLLEVF